jgi:hypothetical protein
MSFSITLIWQLNNHKMKFSSSKKIKNLLQIIEQKQQQEDESS